MAEMYERPGLVVMLSEIDGGRHVGWDLCAQCGKHIKHCRCLHGPVEPNFIKRWRGEQVETDTDVPESTDPDPESVEAVTERSLDAIEVDF